MPYHPSAQPSQIYCTGKHLLNSNRSVLYQDSDHTSHKPRFLNQILMAASTLPRNSNPHQHHHLHLHHSPFGVDTPRKGRRDSCICLPQPVTTSTTTWWWVWRTRPVSKHIAGEEHEVCGLAHILWQDFPVLLGKFPSQVNTTAFLPMPAYLLTLTCTSASTSWLLRRVLQLHPNHIRNARSHEIECGE